MPGEGDECLVQVLGRAHESNRAIEAHQSIEIPAQVEVHHVTEVKLDIREVGGGEGQHGGADVQPGDYSRSYPEC